VITLSCVHNTSKVDFFYFLKFIFILHFEVGEKNVLIVQLSYRVSTTLWRKMIYCFLKNDKCFHTNTSHLLKASRGRERLDLVGRQKTNGLCCDDFKTSVLFLRGFDSVSGEKNSASKARSSKLRWSGNRNFKKACYVRLGLVYKKLILIM